MYDWFRLEVTGSGLSRCYAFARFGDGPSIGRARLLWSVMRVRRQGDALTRWFPGQLVSRGSGFVVGRVGHRVGAGDRFADGTAAAVVKSGFDPKTTKESARTEDSIEFTNADGARTMVLSQVSVSVLNGRPVGIRSTPPRRSEGLTSAARTGVGIELAEFADHPKLFRMNQNGTSIAFELKGAGKAGRTVSGSAATYASQRAAERRRDLRGGVCGCDQ
ncbi:hypothetical protein ACQPW1_11985 [Nocardia sp. CA-128927]|uniref:hypothetical protein n=1 Tax=Nocardia sp. CA-128927 TaxID=3239975 RepID=UPI003D983E13